MHDSLGAQLDTTSRLFHSRPTDQPCHLTPCHCPARISLGTIAHTRYPGGRKYIPKSSIHSLPSLIIRVRPTHQGRPLHHNLFCVDRTDICRPDLSSAPVGIARTSHLRLHRHTVYLFRQRHRRTTCINSVSAYQYLNGRRT